MRIKGHPVHMMVVHFPSALLPVHFLFHLINTWRDETHYSEAAALILPVAVAGGWVALFTGTAEFVRLLWAEDSRLTTAAVLHAGINLCVIGFYTIILAIGEQWHRAPSATTLALEGMAIALLVMGNFFAGVIITRYLKF